MEFLLLLLCGLKSGMVMPPVFASHVGAAGAVLLPQCSLSGQVFQKGSLQQLVCIELGEVEVGTGTRGGVWGMTQFH